MFLTERLKGEEIEAASNPMLKSSNASRREKPLGNLETQCFASFWTSLSKADERSFISFCRL